MTFYLPLCDREKKILYCLKTCVQRVRLTDENIMGDSSGENTQTISSLFCVYYTAMLVKIYSSNFSYCVNVMSILLGSVITQQSISEKDFQSEFSAVRNIK